MRDHRTLNARAKQLIKAPQAAHLLAEAGNFLQVASHFHNDRYWIYGTGEELATRFALTPAGYKRALRQLKDESLIDVMHGPHPILRHVLNATFITLPQEVFEALHLVRRRTKGQDEGASIQQAQIEPVLTYKKNIPEKYGKKSKKTESEAANAPFTAEAVLQDELKLKVIEFRKIWVDGHRMFDKGIAPMWSDKEILKFVHPIVRDCSDMDVLTKAIEASFPDWDEYCVFVEDHLGWKKNIAGAPTIAFVSSSRKAWFDFPHRKIAVFDNQAAVAMFTPKKI